MANAAFSPKDFKAWVIEETDTGNNAGALDAPAITSGLLQLDVDSVSFPSLNVNQNLDVRTSVGRVLHANDFFQDNTVRATEVTLSGTYHNDTGHILLMQSACGVDLQSTVADVAIPTASSTVSGLYGSGTEANKTFTLVLAAPDTTDGYNIVMVGCLCTNFTISADAGSNGGLYTWSATGYAAFARGAELSVTASAQVKYDSVTRPILNNFNTQTAHDAADAFTMTQATATDCSIAIGAGVLTNASLSEGDIMMLDVEMKAVNVGNDILVFNLA